MKSKIAVNSEGAASDSVIHGWLMLREALGMPLYLLAMGGVLLALIRRRREQLLLVATAEPYFVFTTFASWVVVRYTPFQQYEGDYFYSPTIPPGFLSGTFLLSEQSHPETLEDEPSVDYLIVSEALYGNLERLGAGHPKAVVRALRQVLRHDGNFTLVKEMKIPVRLAGIDFSAGFRSQDFTIINPGFKIYRRRAAP